MFLPQQSDSLFLVTTLDRVALMLLAKRPRWAQAAACVVALLLLVAFTGRALHAHHGGGHHSHSATVHKAAPSTTSPNGAHAAVAQSACTDKFCK